MLPSSEFSVPPPPSSPLLTSLAAAPLGAPSAAGSIAEFSALFPNLAPGLNGPGTAPAAGNPAASPASDAPVAGRPLAVPAAAAGVNPLSAPSRRFLGAGGGQVGAFTAPAQTEIAGEVPDASEPAAGEDLSLGKPDPRGAAGPSRRSPAGRGVASSAPSASVEPGAALPLPFIAPELPPAPVVYAATCSELLAANAEPGLGEEIFASSAQEAPEAGRGKVVSAFPSNRRCDLSPRLLSGVVTAKPVNSVLVDAGSERGEGRAPVTPESVGWRRERGPLSPAAAESDRAFGFGAAPAGRTTAAWHGRPVATESAPSDPASWAGMQSDPGAGLPEFSRANISVRPATPIAPAPGDEGPTAEAQAADSNPAGPIFAATAAGSPPAGHLAGSVARGLRLAAEIDLPFPPEDPVSAATFVDAPFGAIDADRLPGEITTGDRTSRPMRSRSGQDSREEFVPGAASKLAPAAIDSPRGENSAARAENRFPRGVRRAEAIFKSFETTAAKEVAATVESVGTDAANLSPSMLESPLNLRTAASPATSAMIGISVAETARTDSPLASDPAPLRETATTVSRAVEAVLTAAESAVHGARNSVNLQFSVGDADLSVRVELRDNEVHATFLTESVDLRTALAQEWRSAAVEVADRPVRFSAPALSGGNGGSLNFNSGAGDTPAGHDHGQRSPSGPGSAAQSYSTGRTSVPAPEATHRINPAPRALPTSVHLHTLA